MIMDNMRTVFMDLGRLRDDYDSQILIEGIFKDLRDSRLTKTYSVGYNEGRNRRDLLEMFRKSHSRETSFISPKSMSIQTDNFLTLEFLKSCRQPEHHGGYFLNLKGSRVEKSFHRRLNDADLDILFAYVVRRPKISGISLPYNNLTNQGFAKLSEFLANQKSIRYVNVMNNEITHLDENKLEEQICKWKVLCLNLRGNKIGQKGGETMAYLLTKNSTIRHLALGETEQTVNSVISIVNTLVQFGGNETLTKLDLTKTMVSTNAGELCRHLACVVEVSHTLVELILSKNDISDHDLEIFLEGLKHRNVLSRLNLSSNRITSHGAELFANVLPKTELKLLVLAGNMIGDSGAMAIGRTFTFTKLKYLDLSKNNIEDKGMTYLILAIDRPMDGFLISGNKITDHVAKVIQAQFMYSLLNPKMLDIRLWFDEEGNIHFARRNLWRYSDWYYYVPEWKHESKINHCCCPIRGGILLQLLSDE
ncbi:leucine-rich repeat-containing protein 34-like [Halyomorpha halys]|uniref:leucine-rich repeat-containing protein 34-like n=1 Tax=Halyomorpha halys TaxID=286706 RepID=UPI0034D30692